MRHLSATVLGVAAFFLSTIVSAARNEVMTTDGGKIKFNGGSGWINFCPASANDTATDGADDSCVTIRPFGYEEVDSSGSTVSASGSGKKGGGKKGGGKKRKNNLFSAMTVSSTAPLDRMEPDCKVSAPYPCGYTTANASIGLQRQQLSLSLDLSEFDSGTIDITLIIFKDNGTLTWDSKDVAVTEGTMKFNVDIKGYKFEAAGNSVEFEMIVKQKGESPGSKTSNDLGGETIDGLVNFPRFVIPTTDAGVTTHSFRTCTIDSWTSGSNTGVRYSFPGNFTTAFYDPMIHTRVTSSSGAPVPAPGVAGGDSTGIVLAVVGGVVLMVGVLGLVIMSRRRNKGAVSDFTDYDKSMTWESQRPSRPSHDVDL